MITLDMLTTTELLEATRTLLAARQLFSMQATHFRCHGNPGGEQARAWASQHLKKLDEEIFAVVMELDGRNLEDDEDAQLERDIAIRESHDVLPFEAPFSIVVIRENAA